MKEAKKKTGGGGCVRGGQKTYSTRDSLVVTDPTTSLAIGGLSMGEQTGSRVLHHLWPYVIEKVLASAYIAELGLALGL